MVSRETDFYTIENFFELYKKTILKTRAKSPGTLSLEAAALTVLSFSDPVGLFIIISPDEKTSNSLYTESYGICPDSSYLFPDLEPENDRVPGFVSEGQRYAEEALSVLFSKNVLIHSRPV